MTFTDMRRKNSGIWQRRRERARPEIRMAISDWDLVKFSGQLSHQIWYEVWDQVERRVCLQIVDHIMSETKNQIWG